VKTVRILGQEELREEEYKTITPIQLMTLLIRITKEVKTKIQLASLNKKGKIKNYYTKQLKTHWSKQRILQLNSKTLNS